MRVTFLGHQGWLIENDTGSGFLLDPILEAIGNEVDRMPIWPRRRLDFGKMPPIDAVIVSHEHADHFSLETLEALPCRKAYISELSSSPMHDALQEMGFEVVRYSALNPVLINGIRVTALPGLYNTLEPDVYGLLMQDDSGASFLTAIDTVAHPDIFGWLEHHCPQRTLDNLTNNFIEPRQPLVNDPRACEKSRTIVMGTTMEYVDNMKPFRVVISGQGWCFGAERDEYNHSFFSVDNHWLEEAATALIPTVAWWRGEPGMRFSLNGLAVAVDSASICTLLPAVDRSFDSRSVAVAEPFAPWTRETMVTEDRLSQVQQFITKKLGAVVGGYAPKLMEGLYYLKFQHCGDRPTTMHVVLRNGTGKYIYEFDYGLLRFSDVTASVKEEAVLGLEIWAADFELIIAAAEEAFLIYESAVRVWSHMPEFIAANALIESFTWFTPRFRPVETLAFYRTQIAKLSQQK